VGWVASHGMHLRKFCSYLATRGNAVAVVGWAANVRVRRSTSCRVDVYNFRQGGIFWGSAHVRVQMDRRRGSPGSSSARNSRRLGLFMCSLVSSPEPTDMHVVVFSDTWSHRLVPIVCSAAQRISRIARRLSPQTSSAHAVATRNSASVDGSRYDCH
jgi:hypothetical protein